MSHRKKKPEPLRVVASPDEADFEEAGPRRLTFRFMTWDLLEEKHGVLEGPRRALLTQIAEVAPSPVLVANVQRGLRSRLANERAKAYRLVDPVIAEVEALRPDQISSIPEAAIEIKGKEGLCGNPDFLISGSTTSKLVPIVSIVEAKKDDIDAGLPQCAAELYAAYLMNGERPEQLYGCVTTGREWRFLCFVTVSRQVIVDLDVYYINELPRLLGVLCHIVDTTLLALQQKTASASRDGRA